MSVALAQAASGRRLPARLVPSTIAGVSREAVEDAVRTLIAWTGDSPERPELLATPTRVASAFRELFAGYAIDPVELLTRSLMANETGRQVVQLRNLRFVSFCEHHMLPFSGHAHIAYLPGPHLVGLGTIAQALDALARRLQVQERLIDELAAAFSEAVAPLGLAIAIEAEHLCMSARGSKACAAVVTTRLLGEFAADDTLRRDFLMAVQSPCRTPGG